MAAAITGFGVVSGFGAGVAVLRDAMRAGRSAVRPVERFDTTGLSAHRAALVPGFDTFPMGRHPDGAGQRLAVRFAVDAGREALLDAGLEGAGVALVLGTNVEDRPDPLDALAARIGDALGLDGARLVTSIACASSASALGLALGLVERGDADAVLAGGTDAISPWVMAGFDVVGALGPGAPFGPVGMALGEGAALMVLEPVHRARSRGARIHAVLTGAGLAADGHHPTAPAPDGRGFRMAIRRATPGPVAYVNAHGTGTEANDVPEAIGIAAAAPDARVSGGKGLLGHAQGAASALELATVLIAHGDGERPPTWGTSVPRPGAPHGLVLAPEPSGGPWVAVSAAFGGAVAALAFDADPPPAAGGPVFVGPVARVGSDPLAAAAFVRRSDLSREDPTGVFAVGSAARALDAAGVRIRRADRERVGLVLGLATSSPTTADAFQRQLAQGMDRVQGGTFARVSLVASAGLVSRELGLHGPMDVLAAGPLSALVALIHGASWMGSGDLEGVVVGSATEGMPEPGGAAVWLGRSGDVAITGWALGPAADPAGTLRRAGADGLDPIDASGDPSGVHGLVALQRARAVCLEAGGVALLGVARGGLSAAVVLRRAA